MGLGGCDMWSGEEQVAPRSHLNEQLHSTETHSSVSGKDICKDRQERERKKRGRRGERVTGKGRVLIQDNCHCH